MIPHARRRARDMLWQAQHELWQDGPDFQHVRELGMAALEIFDAEKTAGDGQRARDWANAYLIVARAHEGLGQWDAAYKYWGWCRGLYPEGWNAERRNRMGDCRKRLDDVDSARRGSASSGYRP